jgi:hypothetical protein
MEDKQMGTSNSEFTGVFVTDESGNHYLLPGEWANRLQITPEIKREMQEKANSEVSGYNYDAMKLVMMNFGSTYNGKEWSFSSPNADSAGDADHWTKDGHVDIKDYNAARNAP